MCGWTFCERFGVLGVRLSSNAVSAQFPASAFNASRARAPLPPPTPPELQGVSQEGAELRPHHRLDVVLPGDRFLQEEVGRGPQDGDEGSAQPARLP